MMYPLWGRGHAKCSKGLEANSSAWERWHQAALRSLVETPMLQRAIVRPPLPTLMPCQVKFSPVVVGLVVGRPLCCLMRWIACAVVGKTLSAVVSPNDFTRWQPFVDLACQFPQCWIGWGGLSSQHPTTREMEVEVTKRPFTLFIYYNRESKAKTRICPDVILLSVIGTHKLLCHSLDLREWQTGSVVSYYPEKYNNWYRLYLSYLPNIPSLRSDRKH